MTVVQEPVVGRPVKVCVVGSLNHDITVWVPRRPSPDETLHGDRVAEFRGGKGANQAVAAARLDAEVAMVGCVGDDARAQFLLEGLADDTIDASRVTSVPSPTGVALITVDPDDVSIVVVAGANAALTPAMVDAAADAIDDADVLLLQGESPADAARQAAERARAASTTVVFNPAPFNDVAAEVAPLTDVMIVNRGESEQLQASGVATSAAVTVTTLGAAGCEVSAGGTTTQIPASPATMVDPTGAGDCFSAAFAVRYAETGDPVAAARFAAAAGACAVEVAGAQPSLPRRDAVEQRLADVPPS